MIKIVPIRAFQILGLLFLFSGCEDNIPVTPGPCQFPPSTSKFPELSLANCDECYFTIQLGDKTYSFTGKQIETIPFADWSPYKTNLIQLTKNSFVEFYFVAPATTELLYDGLGMKTPILAVDTLSKLGYNKPPTVSVSFGLYNYCNDFFEPVTGNIDQSYHQLTHVDLIESYPATVESDSVQVSYFDCSGEINATFVINGETQTVNANYKVRTRVWELK